MSLSLREPLHILSFACRPYGYSNIIHLVILYIIFYLHLFSSIHLSFNGKLQHFASSRASLGKSEIFFCQGSWWSTLQKSCCIILSQSRNRHIDGSTGPLLWESLGCHRRIFWVFQTPKQSNRTKTFSFCKFVTRFDSGFLGQVSGETQVLLGCYGYRRSERRLRRPTGTRGARGTSTPPRSGSNSAPWQHLQWQTHPSPLYMHISTHEIHELSWNYLDSISFTSDLLQVNFWDRSKTCSAEVALLSGGASSFRSVDIPFRSVGSSGTQKDETKRLVTCKARWEILNEYPKKKQWDLSAREILSRRFRYSFLSRCQTWAGFGLLPSGFTTGSTRGSHAEALRPGEPGVMEMPHSLVCTLTAQVDLVPIRADKSKQA